MNNRAKTRRNKRLSLHLESLEDRLLLAAVDDGFGTDKDSAITVPSSGVLLNDTFTAPLVNLARTGVAEQTSTRSAGGAASRAIDGNTNGSFGGNSVTHTANAVNGNWWQVNLGGAEEISLINVFNRTDCCRDRLDNFRVSVWDGDPNSGGVEIYGNDYNVPGGVNGSMSVDLVALTGDVVSGNHVRIQLNESNVLSLAEVEVMGLQSRVNIAPLGIASQITTRAAGGAASRAIDGNTNGVFGGNSVTHTAAPAANAWWQVELGGDEEISNIRVFNRTDCCANRLDNFRVSIWSGDPNAGGVEQFGQDYSLAGGVPGVMMVSVEELMGGAVTGDFVRVELNDTENLSLAEVEIYAKEQFTSNVAIGGTASQSTTRAAGGAAARAIDGNTNGSFGGNSVTHTAGGGDTNPWWQVDLGATETISKLRIFNRTDCCGARLASFRISVWDGDPTAGGTEEFGQDFTVPGGVPGSMMINVAQLAGGLVAGDFVRVQLTDNSTVLSLAEVEVFAPASATVVEVNGVGANVGTSVTLASQATVTVNADGSFTYDPTTAPAFAGLTVGQTAADSFTYAFDDIGGLSTATVNMTVTGPNDPPIASDNSYTVDEDSAVSGNVIVDDTGAGADSEPDGQSMSITAINGLPSNVGNAIVLASGATLTVLADGSFTYDASTSATFNALDTLEQDADSFTYTVADPLFADDTATVSLTIDGVNDAPVALDNAYSATESTTATGNAIADDTGAGIDSDPDTSDSLTVSSVDGGAVGVNVVLASGATVQMDAAGNFTYDPSTSATLVALERGDVVTDSFTYTVTDGDATSTATVNVMVSGESIVVRDLYGVADSTQLNIPAPGVLANDISPSGPVTVISADGTVLSGGTVSLISTLGAAVTINDDGSFTYDPTVSATLTSLLDGEVLTDTIQYTAEDGAATQETTTLSVQVHGVANIANDILSTDEDTGLSAVAPGLSGNDSNPVPTYTNIATAGIASQSTTRAAGGAAARAIDGNTNGVFGGNSVTHTNTEAMPWWQVDLGSLAPLSIISIFNRTDCCANRLDNFRVSVYNGDPNDGGVELFGQDYNLPAGVAGSMDIDLEAANGAPIVGDFVRVQLGVTDVLSLAEVEVLTRDTVAVAGNQALGKPTSQSSTRAAGGASARAVDGNTNGVFGGNSVTHTNGEANPWWQVDMSYDVAIDTINLFNRTDCCQNRLDNFRLSIWSGDPENGGSEVWGQDYTPAGGVPGSTSVDLIALNGSPVVGDFVRVQLRETNVLSLAEVQVMGIPFVAPVDVTHVQGTDLQGAAATVSSDLGADVTVSPDGSYDYDPTVSATLQALPVGQVADDSFTYESSGDTAIVMVAVTGVNDQPEANPVVDTTNEDAGIYSTDLLDAAVTSDVDTGTTLTISSLIQDVAGSDRDLAGAFTLVGGVLSFDANLYNDLAVNESETLVFDYIVDDQSGEANATNSSTVTITIEGRNDSPVADAGGPYSSPEGSALTLDGTNSSDPDTSDTLTYAWDVDGDGDFDENISGANPTLTLAELTALGLDDGLVPPSSINVTLQVSDGLITVTSATTLEITNVAPAVTSSGPAEGSPNEPQAFIFTITDPSPVDDAAGFDVTIDWGDGVIVMLTGQTSTVAAEHIYEEFGDYTITTTATDKDGESSAISSVISIVPVRQIGDDIVAGGLDRINDRIIFTEAGRGRILVRYNGVPYGLYDTNANTTLIAYGGGGNDRITFASLLLPTQVFGNEGKDYIAGGRGSDELYGGPGRDTILAGEGDNYVDGGDDNDVITSRSGNDVLRGGAGNDRILSGSGDDAIFGDEGNDQLSAGNGHDLVHGGLGNDFIDGGSGNDVLFGGSGNDRLNGGTGQDLLIGGSGQDAVRGGSGVDILTGGNASNEDDEVALMQLLTDWSSTQTSPTLGTISDDATRDALRGDSGADTIYIGIDDSSVTQPSDTLISL